MKFSTILVALSCAVAAFANEYPRDDSGLLEARDDLDSLFARDDFDSVVARDIDSSFLSKREV